jgi:hypothetical protein
MFKLKLHCDAKTGDYQHEASELKEFVMRP